MKEGHIPAKLTRKQALMARLDELFRRDPENTSSLKNDFSHQTEDAPVGPEPVLSLASGSPIATNSTPLSDVAPSAVINAPELLSGLSTPSARALTSTDVVVPQARPVTPVNFDPQYEGWIIDIQSKGSDAKSWASWFSRIASENRSTVVAAALLISLLAVLGVKLLDLLISGE